MTTPEERRAKRLDEETRAASGQPQLRRHGVDAELAKAFAIAHNPDFQSMFETLRSRYITEMEQCYLDGSQEADRKALLTLNRYQALMDLKRTIFGPIVVADRVAKRDEKRQAEQPEQPEQRENGRDRGEKRPRRAPRN